MSDLKSHITTFLPYVLSGITIWMTLAAGSKWKNSWLIGLGNQALWMTWIIASGTWGLLPLTITLTIVYVRNHLAWRAQQ